MIIDLVNQYADQFLRVGIHFLWQGTAIAVVAAFASRFLCQTARQRANLFVVSLLALFACVPMTLLSLGLPASPGSLEVSVAAQASSETSRIPIAMESGPKLEGTLSRNPLSLSLWIVGIYLVGLSLMIARVLAGYHASRKVRRVGQPVSEEAWSGALTQALASMKLKKRPAMIWSTQISSPVITGIIRPMIVLPVSVLSGLPREQAVAILSHELAHLSRFDHLVVVFERFLEALFFFHPAVWYLSRRLDQEREKACDDLVVEAGHNRSDYAEVLVTLAGDQPGLFALAAAKNTELKERVLRILNQPQPASVQVNDGGWLAIAVAITGLAFLSISPAFSQEKELERAESAEGTAYGKKLQIVIPELSLSDTNLEQAIEFLRVRSKELDSSQAPSSKGINFVLQSLPNQKKPGELKIDRLEAQNFTIEEAIEAVCLKTGTGYSVGEFAVTIFPLTAEQSPGRTRGQQIGQRAWKAPENFLDFITPKAAATKSTSTSVKDLLVLLGVSFPKDSSVNFVKSSNTLTARNTQANLDLIDAIVKSAVNPAKAKEDADVARASQEEQLKELQKIVLPEVAFENTPLEDAVEFLRLRARELDPAEKGVNINFYGGELDLGSIEIKKLHLKNIPMDVVVEYVCHATKTRYTVKGRNISIFPLDE